MTIVDSGTGNGIWALEIAAEYGGCKVIALDVRLPEHQGKPENLIYTEADVTQPWPIESNSVDFVFQRSMGHVISQQHWPQLVCEIHRVLKPKGRMELIEADLWHHNPGPILRAFNEFLEVQCEKNEIDFRITERIPKEIEAAGFQTIEYRSLDIPIGEWPQDEELKQFGFINKEIQKALLRNRKSDYMALWGLTSDDYDSAIQDMMNEFEDYRGFSRFNCWTAQKNH
ncbi:S-adenosyl-L-methionine-dependent methyltransferase [Sporodiniella umbellata]|nr:S-adenosyl-L-methionine-dependent methyltransferase [Sporodiniella umbellata]